MPQLEGKTAALLITVAFSAVGVLGDYFLETGQQP